MSLKVWYFPFHPPIGSIHDFNPFASGVPIVDSVVSGKETYHDLLGIPRGEKEWADGF